MKIEASKKDVAWNAVGTAVSMSSNFLLLPFLIRFLSPDELGLWYAYLAIGGLVTLFEFGFSPTFSRSVSYLWSGARGLKSEGCDASSCDIVDREQLACLLGVCKDVYRRIFLIALVTVGFFGTGYVAFISFSVVPIRLMLVSWLLFASSSLVNLYYLYYSALLRGIGKIGSDNKIKVTARALQLVVSAVFLVAGLGLPGVSLGYFAYVVVFRVASSRAFWRDELIRKMDLLSIVPSKEAKEEMRSTVSHNALRDGVVQVSNYAATQASTILSSLLLGLQEMAYYSISLQFATAVGTLSLSCISALRPAIQSAYQRRELREIQVITGRGSVFYLLCYAFCTIVIFVGVYPLLPLLKPGSLFDPWVYGGVALYMFLFDWHSLFASVLASFNRIPYMWAYVVSSLAGLLCALVFVSLFNWGIWGLIGGLALPQLLYNNWRWPMVTARHLGTTVGSLVAAGLEYWLNAMKKLVGRVRFR